MQNYRQTFKTIKFEPLLYAAEIGVTVKNGVDFLTGEVDTYIKKFEAENAVKKFKGVKAIILKIEVKFPNDWSKTDTEVVEEVLYALKNPWSVPRKTLSVKVENGWVTLGGVLPWNHQREDSENAVHYLKGVQGFSNEIVVKSESHDDLEKHVAQIALKRSAIDDSNMIVTIARKTLTLSGAANSWCQKEEAERIAWKTPGIWHLNNQLQVAYHYSLSKSQARST